MVYSLSHIRLLFSRTIATSIPLGNIGGTRHNRSWQLLLKPSSSFVLLSRYKRVVDRSNRRFQTDPYTGHSGPGTPSQASHRALGQPACQRLWSAPRLPRALCRPSPGSEETPFNSRRVDKPKLWVWGQLRRLAHSGSMGSVSHLLYPLISIMAQIRSHASCKNPSKICWQCRF